MIWVMTQDKDSLLNVKEITVKENNIEGIVERRFFIEWKKTLGTYDSNKRAYEVLTELYKKIDESSGGVINLAMPKK